MARQRLWKIAIAILEVVIATIVALLVNAASSQVSLIASIPLPIIWILIGLFSLVGIALPVHEYRNWNSSPTATLTSPPPRLKESRRSLINRISSRVKDQLNDPLYHKTRVALNLIDCPQALAGSQQRLSRPLPLSTQISRIFDAAQGELLLLGKPGSGKTMLLLELARILLMRAKRNESYPVPVLFHLSSWSSKRQKLDLWLREELRTKYQVPIQLAQFWVSNRQILPLLDGLDEVPTRYRSKCVEIINDFRLESGSFPMVICCREDDYFAQEGRLLLERALTMQPLTKEQVDMALSKAGVKREELRTAFQNESELYGLAAKPLFLKVLMHICQEGGTGDLVFTGSFETERKDLFDPYVHHMLRSQRRQQAQKRYDPEMAISWLSWLAERMNRHNKQAEFYIEYLQIDWFAEQQPFQLYFVVMVGPIIALFGWVIYMLFFTRHFGLTYGLIDASLVSLFFLLVYIGVNSLFLRWIVPLQRDVPASTKAFWTHMPSSLITLLQSDLCYALLIGIPVGSFVGILMGYAYDLGSGVAYGLFNIFSLTLEFVVFRRIKPEIQPVEVVVWSRKKIVESLRQSLLWGILFGLFLELLFVPDFGPIRALLLGIPLGLFFSGILFVVFNGSSQQVLDRDKYLRPNEGIWRSLRHCALLGCTTGGVSAVFFGVIYGLLQGSDIGFFYSLITGITIGGIAAFRGGGVACVQHVLLRFLLWQAGYIPWHYAKFLDYAADLVLLSRVGGGYIFAHRLLQDYFDSLAESKRPR